MKVTLQYAERQLRHWKHKVEMLRLTSNASNKKENEEGKENFPPAPPIREKEEGKENKNKNEKNARAREVSLRDERIAMVRAYNDEMHGDIDAEYFVDYYSEKFPRDWKARFRNWLKTNKGFGRIVPTAATKTAAPTFTAEQWRLCAERCANCRDGKCVCGITVPPEFNHDWPHPPEECPYFKSL